MVLYQNREDICSKKLQASAGDCLKPPRWLSSCLWLFDVRFFQETLRVFPQLFRKIFIVGLFAALLLGAVVPIFARRDIIGHTTVENSLCTLLGCSTDKGKNNETEQESAGCERLEIEMAEEPCFNQTRTQTVRFDSNAVEKTVRERFIP